MNKTEQDAFDKLKADYDEAVTSRDDYKLKLEAAESFVEQLKEESSSKDGIITEQAEAMQKMQAQLDASGAKPVTASTAAVVKVEFEGKAYKFRKNKFRMAGHEGLLDAEQVAQDQELLKKILDMKDQQILQLEY